MIDPDKIYEFEGEITECEMPNTIKRGDECMYWYFFKKTSNDQFDQIKISFEIDAIAPSQPPKIYKLLYEKDYSIIDKTLDKDQLYPLLYSCILDAFEHFKLKMVEVVVNYPYLEIEKMKISDYEEEYSNFQFEQF